MKDAFNNMYKHDVVKIGGVRQAVLDGVLTEADYEEITGGNYEQDRAD